MKNREINTEESFKVSPLSTSFGEVIRDNGSVRRGGRRGERGEGGEGGEGEGEGKRLKTSRIKFKCNSILRNFRPIPDPGQKEVALIQLF